MKFEEALVELRKGKTIKEVGEYGKNIVLEMKRSTIKIVNEVSEKQNEWLLQRIITCEWKVVEEPGKTFDQVFEALKHGKKIRRKQWSENFYLKKYDGKFNNYSDFLDINYCTVNDMLQNDWEVM